MLPARHHAPLFRALTSSYLNIGLRTLAFTAVESAPSAEGKEGKKLKEALARKRASPKNALEAIQKSNLTPVEKLLARQAELDKVIRKPARRTRERRSAATAQTTETEAKTTKGANNKRKSTKTTATIPPRLLAQTSDKHNDLTSFLVFAEREQLKTTTNVYKGTHYEYTVAEALKAFNFDVRRTGRSNDLGIDLVGHWTLPESPKDSALKVLIQCKATKPTPSMARELEGAYVGAPAGWRGAGVLAFLVCAKEPTRGVRAALQRSRWPVGVLQISREGQIKQFVWNHVAAESGLGGLGVTARYTNKDAISDSDDEPHDSARGNTPNDAISLSWMGKPWRDARSFPPSESVANTGDSASI